MSSVMCLLGDDREVGLAAGAIGARRIGTAIKQIAPIQIPAQHDFVYDSVNISFSTFFAKEGRR